MMVSYNTRANGKERPMKPGMQLIVYPVKDIARAKALFREVLGVEPYADAPYYVGFRVGDQEIGLDPNGHASGLTGPIGYIEVDDIQDRLRALLGAGARERKEVTDVGGGKLIVWVEDADGNLIGLQQAPAEGQ
jgi:predicted enzyme related to lactoylglutathione lyase